MKNFKVYIYEYERCWGSKIDETIFFETEEEALKYIKDFNSYNTKEKAPDIFWVAKKGW